MQGHKRDRLLRGTSSNAASSRQWRSLQLSWAAPAERLLGGSGGGAAAAAAGQEGLPRTLCKETCAICKQRGSHTTPAFAGCSLETGAARSPARQQLLQHRLIRHLQQPQVVPDARCVGQGAGLPPLQRQTLPRRHCGKIKVRRRDRRSVGAYMCAADWPSPTAYVFCAQRAASQSQSSADLSATCMCTQALRTKHTARSSWLPNQTLTAASWCNRFCFVPQHRVCTQHRQLNLCRCRLVLPGANSCRLLLSRTGLCCVLSGPQEGARSAQSHRPPLDCGQRGCGTRLGALQPARHGPSQAGHASPSRSHAVGCRHAVA